MALILIACTDRNMGIGDKDGNLLFKIPQDLKRFKEITTNKHVVMGRKTWESLPVKPLPKRKNYILTTDENYEVQGRTKVLHDLGEILTMARQRDVYVIGGGQVYKQLIDHANVILLTQVHAENRNATTFFPDIDVREWGLVNSEKHSHIVKKKLQFTFTFSRYERKMSPYERQMKDLEFIAKAEKAKKEKDNQEN